jgi:FtsP/CotA-like multicopper oxidase with cupredoxin domain
MPHRRSRLSALLIGLGLVAGCGSGSSTTRSTSSSSSSSTTTLSSSAVSGNTIAVTVVGGEVQGGAQRHAVHLGDPVTIQVTSDVAEEIHVHGYDIKREIAPGETVQVTFTADIPGIFEVELEQSGRKLAELEIS